MAARSQEPANLRGDAWLCRPGVGTTRSLQAPLWDAGDSLINGVMCLERGRKGLGSRLYHRPFAATPGDKLLGIKECCGVFGRDGNLRLWAEERGTRKGGQKRLRESVKQKRSAPGIRSGYEPDSGRQVRGGGLRNHSATNSSLPLEPATAPGNSLFPTPAAGFP